MKKYVIINTEEKVWSQNANINHDCPFWGNGENAIIFTSTTDAKREWKFNDIPSDARVAEWDEDNVCEVVGQ